MANGTQDADVDIAVEWEGDRLRVYLDSEYTSLMKAERWRTKVERAGFVAITAPIERIGMLLPVGTTFDKFVSLYKNSALFRELLTKRLRQREALDDLAGVWL